MKKMIALMLAGAMSAACLAGCNTVGGSTPVQNEQTLEDLLPANEESTEKQSQAPLHDYLNDHDDTANILQSCRTLPYFFGTEYAQEWRAFRELYTETVSNDDLTEEEVTANVEVLRAYIKSAEEFRDYLTVKYDFPDGIEANVADVRNLWNIYQEHKANGENELCDYCICVEDILKDYPDIDSVQLRQIYAQRFLSHNYYCFGYGSKILTPFAEARIAGLVDDDTPKLTLQTAKEIIAQYGDDFGKVLEAFESVQPYPDKDFNSLPFYCRPECNIGMAGAGVGYYKSYATRNADGTQDTILVINRRAIVHNQYDADGNNLSTELLLDTDDYESVFMKLYEDDYNGLYVYRHPEEFS